MYLIGLDIGTMSIGGVLVDGNSGEITKSMIKDNHTECYTANSWEHCQVPIGFGIRFVRCLPNFEGMMWRSAASALLDRYTEFCMLTYRGTRFHPLHVVGQERLTIVRWKHLLC
ncbi:hypothetical protein [Paenibacillus sp. RC67]|uniref:hypothetical protein n=1 Tax=Paenibacillus sp. RC67 TaxID=3039392 RepID=UPI0024AE763F|nr:hypothetical protein [Paenibacillus sp. RC67]